MGETKKGTLLQDDIDGITFIYPISTAITVNSPNGGETWTAGASQNISWTSSGVTNVQLEYSTNNGASWTTIIASTAAIAGSFPWTVPNVNSSQSLVRVSDASNGSVSDVSNAVFTIIPVTVPVTATVTVISPNGGETWKAGTSQNITWTSSGVTNVLLEYSANSGASWTTITASTAAGAGSFSWTVPNANSSQSLVRVSDASNGSVSDQSNAVFTIIPVTVTVISPNGGERLVAGKTYPVTWSQQNVANVKLEYSTDNGSSWTTITASTSASAGTFPWTVPDASSTTSLVKASDAANAAVRDSSDAVFTIARPAVTVTAPNGGEVWTAGSQRTITWTSSDMDSVKVEFSSDEVNAWTVITDGMPATGGSLSWTAPNVNSPNCLVRVTNRSGLAVSDVSNAVFTIIPVTVTVTSPNGGETWFTGEFHPITWVSSGITNVKLEFTPDGLTWVEIASNLDAATGSYSWSIPKVTSTKCLVRISNTAILTVTDQSDSAFTIIDPVITLTSPNGGEQWAARRTLPITWEEIGIPLAKLEYSTDNGVNWNLIADNVDTKSRSYLWKVPETLSAKCLVRITDTTNTSRSDISNAVFTIAPPPTLQITSPNGGENWRCTETRNITWISERIDSLRIEYTLNGGQKWTTLALSVPAVAGLYQWKLPDETSSQSLVRITDVSDSTFTDGSDAPFSIFRYNLNADFAVDADLRTPGNQGEDTIYSIGGGKYVGFALYAKEWETASGFTMTLSWNPDKVSFRSASSTNIVDDEITINGMTITPTPETNILGGTFLSDVEQKSSGFYARSFAVQEDSVTIEPDGLIYFAVFRTAATFAEGDTLSIRCEIKLADSNGLVKDLGVRYFNILPGLQPPANLIVSDVPDDHGHSLKLSWTASPSETSGMVSYYRFYRSLTSALSDSIKSLNLFTDIKDVTAWERHAAILVDSVATGITEYTDNAVGLSGVPYYYWIQAVGAGAVSAKIAAGTPTAVKERNALPAAFRLGEARPNPFNPSTTIEYSLPRNARVLLRVYNVSGQKVATIADGTVSAGDHFAVWNASGMPSGVYFYSLKADQGFIETKKALLLK